jgi:hypothetical protein
MQFFLVFTEAGWPLADLLYTFSIAAPAITILDSDSQTISMLLVSPDPGGVYNGGHLPRCHQALRGWTALTIILIDPRANSHHERSACVRPNIFFS